MENVQLLYHISEGNLHDLVLQLIKALAVAKNGHLKMTGI
jgi:hypothetical protein